MKIEFAGPKDRQELKEIYRACFPGDPEHFWDFELDCRMGSDNILVYRENGKILSTVQILPECFLLAGKTYPVQYIYAAATLPEAQGNGLMGKLLERAHRLARERGQRFSVLITQNDSLFDFYARFGYRDCGKVGCVKATDDPTAKGVVRLAQPQDISRMLALYQAEQKRCLSVFRTPETFDLQRRIYEKNVYVYECDGVISAYGFKIGSHMLEVMGPDGGLLLAGSDAADGFTIPDLGADLVRNGCVLPLDQKADDLLACANNIVYLNLMWN